MESGQRVRMDRQGGRGLNPRSPRREIDVMPSLSLRLILVVGALLALPVAARAHAILLDSRPTAAAKVAAGKVTLVLRYNSRVDAARSRIALVPPGGVERVLPILHGDTPDTLTAEAVLTAGPQVVRWQVLAVDGHITRGELRFTATAGAPGP